MQATALQDALEEWEQVRNEICAAVGSKGRDSFVGLTLEVQTPRLICARDGLLSSPNRHLILSNHGLAIEDEEWRGLVLFPAIEVGFNMCLDAGQTAEGRQEWLVERRVVEEELEIERGIYRNGTILELAHIGMSAQLSAFSSMYIINTMEIIHSLNLLIDPMILDGSFKKLLC